MLNSPDAPETSGLSRRTLVKAAAWSAPVIAVAVAAPAATASTGFDVFLAPPQAGGGATFYSADFSTRYELDVPVGFVLANAGVLAAPAGTTVTVRYDTRVFAPSPDGPSYYFDGASHTVTASIAENGDTATMTFVIPVGVPAGSDSFSGIRVRPNLQWIAVYPNDGVDGYTPQLATVTLGGDADTTNNTRSESAPKSFPASPWGVALTGATGVVESSDTIEFTLPATASALSVGPNPAVGAFLQLNLNFSPTVTLTSLTVDGVPYSSSVVETAEFSGVYQVALGTLAPGAVVEAAFAYEVFSGQGLADWQIANGSSVSIGAATAPDQRQADSFTNFPYRAL